MSSKAKKVHVVTYEYQLAENDKGANSPEEYYGILGVFEDESDAHEFYEDQRDNGDYGDFFVKSTGGDEWSDEGFWLQSLSHKVYPPSQKTKAKKGSSKSEALDVINLHRVKAGQAKLDPVAAGWSDKDVEKEAKRIAKLNPRQRNEERKGRGDAAIGAGIGSLVGALPGIAIGSAGLAGAGSILGGALGGRREAPEGTRRRSTTGGAIGGIFGPIGAAIGAYIGAGKKDKARIRKRNPALAADLDRLSSADAKKLRTLVRASEDASRKAVVAESRGNQGEALKWREAEAEVDGKLLALEDRLGLFAGRTAQRNPGGSGDSLKRRLMGGKR